MSESAHSPQGQVETFPGSAHSTAVSDELNHLLGFLRSEFPDASKIHFEFDGKLLVHIDVRMSEAIASIEARLSILNGGTFKQVRHGKTPGRAFLHRISALVAR